MRRQTLLVSLAVGMLAVVAVGAIVLGRRPDRVTRENYERLHKGMTWTEVEAILGPPGDYMTGPNYREAERIDTRGSFGDGQWESLEMPAGISKLLDHIAVVPSFRVTWSGDSADVYVWFDRNGAEATALWPHERRPQSFLDNLLWRAKRVWRRWSSFEQKNKLSFVAANSRSAAGLSEEMRAFCRG
jgi:hypothetical protein